MRTRAYVLSHAAKYLGGISVTQVRRLIAAGALIDSDEIRGIRAVTAASLHAELKRRGLPIPNEESVTDA